MDLYGDLEKYEDAEVGEKTGSESAPLEVAAAPGWSTASGESKDGSGAAGKVSMKMAFKPRATTNAFKPRATKVVTTPSTATAASTAAVPAVSTVTSTTPVETSIVVSSAGTTTTPSSTSNFNFSLSTTVTTETRKKNTISASGGILTSAVDSYPLPTVTNENASQSNTYTFDVDDPYDPMKPNE